MSRRRWSLRALMAAVALVAAALGLAAGLHRRSETFRRLAVYHFQAADVLIEGAGGPLVCGTGLSAADIERVFCNRGPAQCRDYRAARYHGDLARKYRRASQYP